MTPPDPIAARGYKTARDHDREGTTPPKWCGSVIPRLNEQGTITCKGGPLCWGQFSRR